MKWCKAFVIGILFSHWAYAEEVFVTLEPVRDDQLDVLHEEFPIADLEDYSTLTVRFQGRTHSEFSRVRSLRTNIEYSQVLTCNGIDYPMVMLQTDASYEKASLTLTSIKNRLYVLDKELNLIEEDESLYWSEEYDDGIYVNKTHHFTLDNVEQYACRQIEKILSPTTVEKAFSSKKGYNEYSISKIQSMFEAYPLSKRNVTQYNNIAYYFEKHKAYEQSVFILEKVLNQYPTRTVAYINLGDAYWGLDQKDKAKVAYEKYVMLMKENGKESKIPKKVLDRTGS
jgi:tetratricopeptide (TPR) repeat protein